MRDYTALSVYGVDVKSEQKYGQLVPEICGVEKVQYNVLTFRTQISRVEHNWLGQKLQKYGVNTLKLTNGL